MKNLSKSDFMKMALGVIDIFHKMNASAYDITRLCQAFIASQLIQCNPKDARACLNEIYNNISGAISRAENDSKSKKKR